MLGKNLFKIFFLAIISFIVFVKQHYGFLIVCALIWGVYHFGIPKKVMGSVNKYSKLRRENNEVVKKKVKFIRNFRKSVKRGYEI